MKFKRFMSVPFTCKVQHLLWLMGIAVHNPFRKECTADFNCCNKIGRKAWLRIPDPKYNEAKEQIANG